MNDIRFTDASHNELAEANRIKLACEFIGVDYDALVEEAKEMEKEEEKEEGEEEDE